MKHNSTNKELDINYEPVIGFEIHVELATKSKMFCGCAADHFGKKPNTQTCPVCLGLPGALPVPNKKAIEWAILLGLALGCDIPLHAKFDRKHYFYPDLSKGYQISQYDEPFAHKGELKFKVQSSKFKVSKEKSIKIRRVHLEEDTGKLIHSVVDGKRASLIDFNRSGVPLVEIVTEPDIHSSEEATVFLKQLRQIIRYLGISDCDMEKGSMRLEPNISLRPQRHSERSEESRRDPSPASGETQDDELPSYKVEVKNINSFRFAARAIDYEINRQTRILDKGKTPKQETRGYNENKGITVSQRSKEEAHDYRYFPEPDIPPFTWEKSHISHLKTQIGELPDKKYARFIAKYDLPEHYAAQLTQTAAIADYFEAAVVDARKLKDVEILPKTIANWMINRKIDIAKTVPAALLMQIKKEITTVFVSDDNLTQALKKVIDTNKKAIDDYKGGKESALMFLVGQVMREVKGKADAKEVKEKMLQKLSA